MSEFLQQQNTLLKQEADALLFEKGLLHILRGFGLPHVHGSYALDLMTWRDLDIYLEADSLPETDFFNLGSKICTALQPVKMSFRNERMAKTPGLPHGLYWGIYLGNERAGAWKIDIWAVDRADCAALLAHCANRKQQLTPAAVQHILAIKSQCWQDPAYRRSYSSDDIYTAVLEKNIADLEGFRAYLHQHNKARG
jgi:hypothetical protein